MLSSKIFGTPEILAIITLKFNQKSQTINNVTCPKDLNGIARSEDPNQTVPVGAV